MMRSFIALASLLACFLVVESARAQHPAAGHAADAADVSLTDIHYDVYTGAGEAARLEDIVSAMDTVHVVFIGEQHDDSVGHALQLELLQRAYAHFATDSTGSERPLALSLEVFERDVQYVLDEYLAGEITEQHFLASSHPWGNYSSDYRALVEFAKAHGIPVIAANAPRRYVNRVARLGPGSLQELSARARAALPPLPYPGPSSAYRAKWMQRMQQAMDTPHGAGEEASATATDTTTHGHGAGSPHGGAHDPMAHLLDAQALWDAAMAYSIVQHLLKVPDALVLHLAGAFHIAEGLGTPEQLHTYRPDTPYLVVAIQAVDDPAHFDSEVHTGLGDFVILTDASLPRTRGGGVF